MFTSLAWISLVLKGSDWSSDSLASHMTGKGQGLSEHVGSG